MEGEATPHDNKLKKNILWKGKPRHMTGTFPLIYRFHEHVCCDDKRIAYKNANQWLN